MNYLPASVRSLIASYSLYFMPDDFALCQRSSYHTLKTHKQLKNSASQIPAKYCCQQKFTVIVNFLKSNWTRREKWEALPLPLAKWKYGWGPARFPLQKKRNIIGPPLEKSMAGQSTLKLPSKKHSEPKQGSFS